MEDEAVALDMPNGVSKEIRYDQKFVYPSVATMPKHQSNNAAKKAPSLDAANKGVYRE